MLLLDNGYYLSYLNFVYVSKDMFLNREAKEDHEGMGDRKVQGASSKVADQRNTYAESGGWKHETLVAILHSSSTRKLSFKSQSESS